ncbi:MAG: PLP-dependent aminotransferase family protein [Roseivivax sp.]|nr:PLP-dependent aminotransferase family protein [Roseivivax sp.]
MLAQAIRDAIAHNALSAGDRLPPVRDLAWHLGITPGTVARAYTVLTDDKVLTAEVGRGTFVSLPNSAVADDVWNRQVARMTNGLLNLFAPQLPDVGQVALMRDAMGRIGEADPLRLMTYPTRASHLPARRAAAHWLRGLPLGGLDPDDVVLTHGGQSGIVTVLQTLLHGPRPVILVEDLSYAGFRRAAELLRAEVVAVPMDAQGLVPEALETLARRHGAQVLCTSPEVHNPTGLCTPPERRRQIADVATRADLQILEDDCYRMGTPKAATYRVLAPGRGWHVSSLSKTLTPALRVGFAVAPQGRGGALRKAAEYGYFGLAQPLAEMMEQLLVDPRAEGLADAVRERVGEYIRVAVNALGAFELSWHVDVPFLWLPLPPGWRAAAFTRAAEGQGIQIRSADEFALRDGRAPHAVRIAVNAQVPLARFEAAMQTLRGLLENPPEQISV